MTAYDNPVWSSLTTLHRDLAIAHGDLLRYPADVAPFLAIEKPGPLAAGSLDALVGDGTVFLIGIDAQVPDGWQLTPLGVIAQMICEAPLEVPAGPPIEQLGTSHEDAIRALAALVYPHYFRHRTAVLGVYHGVLGPDRLDAMIGERMGWPGHREISAVCTHPACVGRGLARRLLAHASNQIFARGDTPLLHVSPANTRAVQLYEQNGYRHTRDLVFSELRRS